MLEGVFALLLDAVVLVMALWQRLVVFARSLVLAPRHAHDAAEIAAAVGPGRPQHLAAVLPRGELDAESVAYLCALMVAAAGEAVTIHQEAGNLEALAPELERLLEGTYRVPAELLTYGPNQQERRRRIRAAAGAERLVTVRLISERQCGTDFVEGAVASLARDCAAGKLAVDEIDRSEVTSRLAVSIADPELVLCFDGPTRNGFLPWSIRFTEFVLMPPLSQLRLDAFGAALRRWAGIKQRYGA